MMRQRIISASAVVVGVVDEIHGLPVEHVISASGVLVQFGVGHVHQVVAGITPAGNGLKV